MLFRYVLTVLIALVNAAHYVTAMILMLVDVLQRLLRKRCIMRSDCYCCCLNVRICSFFLIDCIVCFCMFTAFVANKLHHIIFFELTFHSEQFRLCYVLYVVLIFFIRLMTMIMTMIRLRIYNQFALETF